MDRTSSNNTGVHALCFENSTLDAAAHEPFSVLRHLMGEKCFPVVLWMDPEGGILVAGGAAVPNGAGESFQHQSKDRFSMPVTEASSTREGTADRWRDRFARGAEATMRVLASAPAGARALFALPFDPDERTQTDRPDSPFGTQPWIPSLQVRWDAGAAEAVITGCPEALPHLRNLLRAALEARPAHADDLRRGETHDENGSLADAKIEWNDEEYGTIVREGLSRIAAGSCAKIVLARAAEYHAGEIIDSIGVLRHLHTLFPNCFLIAVVPSEDAAFISATPERLVRVVGSTVSSAAVAGTLPVDAGAHARQAFLASVRHEGKDAREHAFVVEMLRDTLAPLCDTLTVDAPHLLALRNVEHLVTPVTGVLRGDATFADALAALHPTPAVCGTPRDAALAAIHGIESFDRGPYAGAIGWLDARGDGDAAVAIRSALLRGRDALLYAGAGIVRGSDPDEEIRETRAKLRAILDALP